MGILLPLWDMSGLLVLPVPCVETEQVGAKTCLNRIFFCLVFSQETCTVRQLVQGTPGSHFRCRSGSAISHCTLPNMSRRRKRPTSTPCAGRKSLPGWHCMRGRRGGETKAAQMQTGEYVTGYAFLFIDAKQPRISPRTVPQEARYPLSQATADGKVTAVIRRPTVSSIMSLVFTTHYIKKHLLRQ